MIQQHKKKGNPFLLCDCVEKDEHIKKIVHNSVIARRRKHNLFKMRIRRILEREGVNRYNYLAQARWLNSNLIPTPNKKGKWYAQTVKRLYS